MLGVIRETFERDGGSIRGEDDFFSVAKTTPLVAEMISLEFAFQQVDLRTHLLSLRK